MNQVSFALLVVLGLVLTGYVGLAAWHAGDDHAETTGAIWKHR